MHSFQISDTVTAIFGGQNNPHEILTFDWIVMEYLKHKSVLIGSRQYSTCALMKGDNGENLAAVAGGTSPGLEIWNPVDGSVKMLTPNFPQRSNNFPQMISVEQGRKLIYYNTQPQTGIWQFDFDRKNWTKIGDLIVARDDFVTLPVPNIACPNIK